MLKAITIYISEELAVGARSVERWLNSLHPVFFITIVTAATFVVSLLAGVIEVVLEQVCGIVIASNTSTEGILETMGFSIYSVSMVAVAAPILETIIFQHGVIRLCNRLSIFRGKRAVLMLLSAIAFGIIHWRHPFHVFIRFFSG